jgi:competence protein ComEA
MVSFLLFPCTAHAASLETEESVSELMGVVNINDAPTEKLVLLPAIGPARAARIVRYRKKRRFKRTIELARVRGIGLRTVRRLKPYLSVKGATTLRRSAHVPVPKKWRF